MRNFSVMLCQTYNVIFRSFGQSHFRSFSFSIFFPSRHYPRPQRVFCQSLSLLRREEGIRSLFWERKWEIKERRSPASCCNWQGFIFSFLFKKSTLCCLESVNSKTVRLHLHIQYVAVCLSIWYNRNNHILVVNLVLCLNIIGMENGYLARVQFLDAIEGYVELKFSNWFFNRL